MVSCVDAKAVQRRLRFHSELCHTSLLSVSRHGGWLGRWVARQEVEHLRSDHLHSSRQPPDCH